MFILIRKPLTDYFKRIFNKQKVTRNDKKAIATVFRILLMEHRLIASSWTFCGFEIFPIQTFTQQEIIILGHSQGDKVQGTVYASNRAALPISDDHIHQNLRIVGASSMLPGCFNSNIWQMKCSKQRKDHPRPLAGLKGPKRRLKLLNHTHRCMYFAFWHDRNANLAPINHSDDIIWNILWSICRTERLFFGYLEPLKSEKDHNKLSAW